jgi:hypothetical protein
MAIVLSPEGIVYHYKMESASGADENSPLIIAPDTNAVNKRWILCSVVNENLIPIQSGSGTVGTALNTWANVYSELFNDLTLTSQATGFTIAGGTAIRTLTVDETVAISTKAATANVPLHSQTTAENDVLVGAPTPFGSWVKKTIAEFKTILGLGTAAYTASTDYVPHSLATAENDFLIGAPTPFGTFVKKTLAETKAILDYGMFEIDIYGALMPKNTVTSDPYFELDINGAVMPKAV